MTRNAFAPALAARVTVGLVVALGAAQARAEDLHGTIQSVDVRGGRVSVVSEEAHGAVTLLVDAGTVIESGGRQVRIDALKPGMRVVVGDARPAARIVAEAAITPPLSFAAELAENVRLNLFKPLLLFFYMGFLIPILRVKFELPYAIYQGLTIYLLIAIGWHGGEELAKLGPVTLGRAAAFMGVGFLTNAAIGLLAYAALAALTRMRRVDRATVAGYYGSDSAGTFVTCLGVLTTAHVAFDAYMPVMLAVMEVPGCLVALALVSRLRRRGMDRAGSMPDEPGYDPKAAARPAGGADEAAAADEEELSLEKRERPAPVEGGHGGNLRLLHEVFFNPGLYLLVGGIVVGLISGLQGRAVTRADDNFFVEMFQGVLCLFLLEMGMTASRKLRDLRTAGWGYILFGLLAPNVFAAVGIGVAHAYAHVTGVRLELGTYVLFAVLCGSASYIAVPAVQRMAIPEASPTLPLAASLGLTFTYNVTVGIPLYLQVSRWVIATLPAR